MTFFGVLTQPPTPQLTLNVTASLHFDLTNLNHFELERLGGEVVVEAEVELAALLAGVARLDVHQRHQTVVPERKRSLFGLAAALCVPVGAGGGPVGGPARGGGRGGGRPAN